MAYGWFCTWLEPKSYTLADQDGDGNTAVYPLAAVTRMPGGEWGWSVIYSHEEAAARGLGTPFGTEHTKEDAQRRAEEFIVAYEEAREGQAGEAGD